MSAGESFQISESDLDEALASTKKNDDTNEEGYAANHSSSSLSYPPVLAAIDSSSSPSHNKHLPTVVLVVGMAGSGKTTLMSQLYRYLDRISSSPEQDDVDVDDDDDNEDSAVANNNNDCCNPNDSDDEEAEAAAATANDEDEESEAEKTEEGGRRTSQPIDDASPGEEMVCGGNVVTPPVVEGGENLKNNSEWDEAVVNKSTSTTTLHRRRRRHDDNEHRGRRAAAAGGYFLNLDPAVKDVPYGASIDIRDTVDYREVMRQHRLGPNGAIMTSLNLFATKFDQVIQILERRAAEACRREEKDDDDDDGGDRDRMIASSMDYIVVDTPGQIEAFTWSASGTIMSESLASSFPTILVFVVDTPRCAASPNTFMSNMLYACSMQYRTRLPLLVVFNKTDVVPCAFAEEWMGDYESFQESLDEHASESGYYGSLTRSLSLVLDEFYSTLRRCGVSAATGDGMEEFLNAVDMAAEDFITDYIPDLRNRINEQEARKGVLARDGARRLRLDVEEGSTRC